MNNSIDKLEEVFGNIDGIVGVLEKDLIDKGSSVTGNTFSDFDVSCLLSAIKSFTNQGNHFLDSIDKQYRELKK